MHRLPHRAQTALLCARVCIDLQKVILLVKNVCVCVWECACDRIKGTCAEGIEVIILHLQNSHFAFMRGLKLFLSSNVAFLRKRQRDRILTLLIYGLILSTVATTAAIPLRR